jgi:putative SOS response-associated peptidase YedK
MAIITRAPDPEIAAIHDRMPIEIAIDDLALWLDPNTDPSTVIAMMNGPNAPRKAHPVDLPKAKPKSSNLVQGDLFGAD